MGENAAEWERIGRRLLHDELIYYATERLKHAFWDVAEDIQNGHEITAQHLEHLANAFHEVMAFIRECVVPLVENPDEMCTKFELEARAD